MEKPALVNNHISATLMQESPKYEKNLNVLSSIITVSPILGILGTVLGLMDVFNVISGGGLGNASQLSSGIAEALISTVLGLSITIPFIFAYHYLTHQVDQRLQRLEQSLEQFARLAITVRKD